MKLHKRLTTTAAALIAVGLAALTAKAAPPASPQGMLTAKVFLYVPGGTGAVDIPSLTNDVNFPNKPDLVYYPPYFESFPTGDITIPSLQGDWGDGYGDQILGYFYPPTNGNYNFYIASDDYSDLYLSTDSTPANKKLIAQVTAWANRREYGTETGTGDVTTENVSATFAGTQWPTADTNNGGALITLQAGQAYYIEAIHHEGGGGDDLSVSIDGVLPIPGSMVSSIDVPGNVPTVASITGSALFNSVTVTFSEPMDAASATVMANYSLSGGLTISSATLHAASGEGDSNTVVLATSLQPTNTSFTLTINNVKDANGNAIAAATKATFHSYVWVPGWMTYEQWTADGIAADPATFESDLTSNLENLATSTLAEPQFDGPWIPGGVGYNNYNSVSYAWFVAPQDGDYVFFLASDDASDLFLSTDASPANKELIAQEAGYSNEYQWTTVGGNGSTSSDKRSDTFSASAWPTANAITLTNGQKYYLEIDHHQGGGGAGAGAAYMLADDPNIAAGPAQSASGENLTGSVIGSYLDTSSTTVTINTQPANQSTVEGYTAAFSVSATGSSPYTTLVFYQWQSAPSGSSSFVNIPGATGAGYTTPDLALTDSGTQYRVIVSMPGVAQTSGIAAVTVTVDKTPPTAVSAGAISNQLAGTEIGVIISKALTGASATTLANYSLDNGATISAARYVPSADGVTSIVPDVAGGARGDDKQSGVVLSVSTLTPGTTYHLTVKGLTDLFGNVMVGSVSLPVSVSPFTWVSLGETVTNAANPDGATNEVVAVGANSFDLVNGGNAFWGTEDDITMVYETVKGDFDRTVNVEWSDPASHWARAGLQARASVSPADAFGPTVPQYQTVLSDPETNIVYGSVPNSPANDQYESNRRLSTGSATDGNNSEGNPHYPASYVRLKRVGQFISMYYSSSTNDVKWWYPIGTTDFNGATDVNGNPDPLPDQLFVGPTYGCENGNIDGQDGGSLEFTGTFTARFRNYETLSQKARGTATSVIGFNFGNGYAATEPGSVGNESTGTLLSSNDIAGVDAVAQGNWNNMFGFATNWTQTIYSENETTGAATPTSIIVGTSGSPNLWTTQGPGADANQNGGQMTGEDAVLMTGYLDTGSPTTTDVGITNIPPNMVSQGYDVVVYSMGAVDSRGGGFGILDSNLSVIQGYYTMQAPLNPTGFMVATPSAPTAYPTNWAVGNVVVFTNLTASTITVEGTTVVPYGYSGTPRAEINAIQLISPPGLLSGHVIVGNKPVITVSATGVITYTGVLRVGTSVGGPFTPVAGASSPYTIPATGGTRFFVATAN